MIRGQQSSPLFPYTTLFRSLGPVRAASPRADSHPPPTPRLRLLVAPSYRLRRVQRPACRARLRRRPRSEEHTSELQSLAYLVCRLLLEKKKHIISSTCITLY